MSKLANTVCATTRTPSHQGGFTLIELMVVLVIAAILTMIAAPMFEEGLQRNRNLAAMESTLGMVASARSEAVARATTISICPTNDQGASCSGFWEDGAIVFEDNSEDGTGDLVLDDDEERIRIFAPAGEGVAITSTGTFTNLNGIVFDRFGRVEDVGAIAICDDRAQRGLQWARAIVLNASGQARLATDEDGDTIVNIPDPTNTNPDRTRNLVNGDCDL